MNQSVNWTIHESMNQIIS